MSLYQVDQGVDITSDAKQVFVVENNYRTPNKIDHRDLCLPTDNQGNTPHCVGYTVASYLETEYWKIHHIPYQFIASKIYQIGRLYKCDSMSGTRLEYCLDGLKNNNIVNFDCYISTDCKNIVESVKCLVHSYGQLMCAFQITDEWYTIDKSKNVIKSKKHPRVLGGHCVICCGFNTTGAYIQNSWGYVNWGNYGFTVIPWNMLGRQLQYGLVLQNLSFNEDKIKEFINGS